MVLDQLNTAQALAVRYVQGPLSVLAGAGSGKTRVITSKIAYLIQDMHLSAHHILAVTFTNKAAAEMLERVKKVLSRESMKGLTAATFHRFGLEFMKREYKALNFKQNISIFDTHDSISLLRHLSHTDESDAETQTLYNWQQQIARWKGELISPEEAYQKAQTEDELQVSKVYGLYQKQLGLYNALDFEDLLARPLEALETNHSLKERWLDKVRYVLVDEYQDSNLTQYALIKALTYPRGALTVVGDDHQSVYGWRGARPENLKQLELDYPNLKLVKLEQNYRSTPQILQAANTLIQHNTVLFEKKLWASGPPGKPIRVIFVTDELQEANRIASEILSHHFQNRTPLDHYAILYRSNHQVRVIEKALREHQLPYHISGGSSFFAKPEVRDILSYLKLLHNLDDDAAFLRVANTPRREIGPATLEKLSRYASTRNISLMTAAFEFGLTQTLYGRPLERLQNFTNAITLVHDNLKRGDALTVIRDFINELKYDTWLLETSNTPVQAEKRMQNVHELVDWLSRLIENKGQEPRSLNEALNTLMLIDRLEQQQKEDISIPKINCMTLHTAKGLEFPYVFISGLEEGLLPHKTSLDEGNIEEERRLFYVGLTRARQELTLTTCMQRKRFNDVQDTSPSRFLQELGPDLQQIGGHTQVSVEERAERGAEALNTLRQLLERARSPDSPLE